MGRSTEDKEKQQQVLALSCQFVCEHLQTLCLLLLTQCGCELLLHDFLLCFLRRCFSYRYGLLYLLSACTGALAPRGAAALAH